MWTSKGVSRVRISPSPPFDFCNPQSSNIKHSFFYNTDGQIHLCPSFFVPPLPSLFPKVTLILSKSVKIFYVIPAQVEDPAKGGGGNPDMYGRLTSIYFPAKICSFTLETLVPKTWSRERISRKQRCRFLYAGKHIDISLRKVFVNSFPPATAGLLTRVAP